MNKFKYYNNEEIEELLKNERLVYVDDGIDRVVIRYKDIPDFIVDYNNKNGQTDLTFYSLNSCSLDPIITTFGSLINKCDSTIKEDIIERLIDLQMGGKIKKYKIINKYNLDEVRNKLYNKI